MVPKQLVFKLACHLFSSEKYNVELLKELILESFYITEDLKIIYQGIKFFGIDSCYS
jgi:hypothetical protein